MNGPDLVQGLKEACSTENFDNISDAKYYKWLSWSHTRIAEIIKSRVDSKFFYTITKTSLVAEQYKFDELPVNVIDKISIKYSADTDYVRARPVDISEMPESMDYLRANQSKRDPIYFITNEIVMIFPEPDTDVTKGLIATGKNVVTAIDATTVSADLYNGQLKEYQEVIIDGAKKYLYEHLQEFNKKAEAENNFFNDGTLAVQGSLDKMISQISYRGSQPIEYIEPDLSQLLY